MCIFSSLGRCFHKGTCRGFFVKEKSRVLVLAIGAHDIYYGNCVTRTVAEAIRWVQGTCHKDLCSKIILANFVSCHPLLKTSAGL